MKKNIGAMHNEFPYPELINGKTATTPATKNLFKGNPNANKLDQHRAKIFHAFTAKNLFLSQCYHLEIKLTVAFLCTQGKSPDDDNWKKLVRLLSYLYCTKYFFLTSKATNLSIVQ